MDEKNNMTCSGDCSSCGETCTSSDLSTVTLTLNDDSVIECAILTVYAVNDQEYIALLPLDEDGQASGGDVYLYRYLKDENGFPTLENILDDDEYEAAADAFDEYMDELEFEEMDAE